MHPVSEQEIIEALRTYDKVLGEMGFVPAVDKTIADRIELYGVGPGESWVNADDVRRLTHELDVAMNGEAGAAPAPSLCDVVAQASSVARKYGKPLLDSVTSSELETLRERVYTLETEVDAVVQAGKIALREAESWINDQLQGTHSYNSAMAELEPVREILKRYE